MQTQNQSRPGPDLEEINEKLRKDVLRALEPYGARPVAELSDMAGTERTKWLFWNLHERLDEIRKMEPTLIGQVMTTQLTVCDGQSMWSEKCKLEKRLELSCKWHLQLSYIAFQSEQLHEIGDGWINLAIGDEPPGHPSLKPGQKAYLDADHSLYPNQLFLDGWISEGVWQEIKPQLYSSNPACRTDIVILDNYLFPVRRGNEFVSGPAGSIGITNIEFRNFSHPTERRLTRREPRQRS
ncbi:hypothetical protein [Lacisediminimonas sp.]|uniref:hypothetical protein n=1 Tax=Lacisediminimonas sp. TaxID=3060582 RepID=UPI0027272CE5|nr:hypothetical protein [Lacisediminimonas sp.]MDO8300291.1 hypothetical protein [Lacisediminimonas sp.]